MKNIDKKIQLLFNLLKKRNLPEAKKLNNALIGEYPKNAFLYNTLGLILLGVSLFQGVISAVRTYLFSDTTNRIDISLGASIIHHLLRLPLGYFSKRPVGEISNRIGELEKIRRFLTGTALTVLLDAIFSVIYIAVMMLLVDFNLM